jgi:hypothetical protein
VCVCHVGPPLSTAAPPSAGKACTVVLSSLGPSLSLRLYPSIPLLRLSNYFIITEQSLLQAFTCTLKVFQHPSSDNIPDN